MAATVSNDATLKNLTISPGELVPSYWGTRHSFALMLPHAVDAVRINATANDADATLRIADRKAISAVATDPIPVPVGRTVIKVQVTAADGATRDSYEVKVHRATPRPDWVRLLEHAPFKERDSEGEVVFDGRMWIIGGYTPDLVRDVWSSRDGLDWSQVGEVPAAGGVNIPVCLAFAGRMWVSGQDAHLYASRDGRVWEDVGQPPWSPRAAAGFAVFRDRMWVMGGSAGGKLINDVWSSANGRTWQHETEAADWPARQIFSNLVVHRDRLWLIGGGYAAYQPFKTYRDVWSSVDGVHWDKACDLAPWPGRVWTSCVSYRDRLWLIGGFRAQPTWNNFDDVWYTADGSDWHRLETDHIFEPRHEISALVFEDSLWMIAGNAWPLKNDVWKLRIEDLCFVTQPPLEAFAQAEYRYDARADFHQSPGPLSYHLQEAPPWLSVDPATGVVRGIAEAVGDYPVTLEARTPAGETAAQCFTLHVIPL